MRQRGLYDATAGHAACGVGAIVDLRRRTSHAMVEDALRLLEHLDHRAARGADISTGDGTGLLLQKPHRFFSDQVPGLPESGRYGVGQFFLPREDGRRRAICELIEETAHAQGFLVPAWREVPTINRDLGRKARASEPRVAQAFFVPDTPLATRALDLGLYVLRCCIENAVRARGWSGAGSELFHICSLDRSRIVYKGMLTTGQIGTYYPDLRDERTETGLVLVHSRFSTNTLGAWDLAHPHRTSIHNGEFNTVRGNSNWMRTRESDLHHSCFGTAIDKIKPVLSADVHSDSVAFDRVLDLLMTSGRSLPHALRMLIPEAWNHDAEMAAPRRAFYEYHAALMEPWEGPALVVATDGVSIAAVLDRNGLRPCRYAVTSDGRLVLASEAGVLDLPFGELESVGRLRPGQLLHADWSQGRVVPEAETFERLTAAHPYADWLAANRTTLDDDGVSAAEALGAEALRAHQCACHYTEEGLRVLLAPLAADAKDPLGAMGYDAPLAVLSTCHRPLFEYFLQQFAQVSNPPLDYIRERLVTSLESHLGNQRNLLEATPAHCRQLVLPTPILGDRAFAALQALAEPHLAPLAVDTTYTPGSGMARAIARIQRDAEAAVAAGREILILDDRGAGRERVAVPALLATAAVHHHLIRTGKRTRVALAVAAGEPFAVHHLCCLLGYGADAVYPWLAYRSLEHLAAEGALQAAPETLLARYRRGLEDGILKVMSKMGISTLGSYKGAQIFEAVGLDPDFVSDYFPGTVTHVAGIGLAQVERESEAAHAAAYGAHRGDARRLDSGGDFYWRRDGELHQWNPQSIGWLQHAARSNDAASYRAFARSVDGGDGHLYALRDLLDLDTQSAHAIDLAEVEPAETIMQRFFTSSMSFGALSREAHEALAIAMNRIGGKASSGEGGEQVERFGTAADCAIKQIASGRFGVTAHYLAAARHIEIKMAQGSKPGEGGELPGAKVGPEIARVRFTVPGVGLISPPPHHDIYSIEDLAQLIHDLRCANPQAQVHVKLVSKANVGTIAVGVAKAGADAVLISGSEGGTGASIKTSIKHAGTPWELGLPETQQALVANRLRSRVTLRVDGGLKTGRDVLIAALLGAEEFGFGTAALVTLGCVMLRKCHCNTCSVGVATQDAALRRRFQGKPEYVVNYLRFVAEDMRAYMAQLGFRSVQEMVGHADRLALSDVAHPKGRHLDLSPLLYREPSDDALHRCQPQRSRLDEQPDHRYFAQAAPALARREPVRIRAQISNRDRTVGALLSYLLCAEFGAHAVAESDVVLDLDGYAGQSLGAFLVAGIDLRLAGAANDYVGKGLSGGRISVRVPADARLCAEQSVIVGNVALYGATAGEAYFNGLAGERFCVRNSGATAVVEGVGDHGCEYMTGGVAVIIGPVGRNFGAGMSGGEAYLLDQTGDLASHLAVPAADLHPLHAPDDVARVRRLLENHVAATGSAKAGRLLADWDTTCARFVKFLPGAYAAAVRRERERADAARTPQAETADCGAEAS